MTGCLALPLTGLHDECPAAPREPAACGAHAAELADADAARAVLAGDRAAFGHFVNTYQRPVYALLLRMTRLPEQAEDLTQETFLQVFRALGQWDARRPFRPWVYQIARNIALSTLRRKVIAVQSLDATLEAGGQEPADPRRDGAKLREQLAVRETLAHMRECLERLGPDDQALFHLRHVDELSCREIAEIMEARENTIVVRLHRLRERLRQMLRARQGGDDPTC